jgi:hypothetical protein
VSGQQVTETAKLIIERYGLPSLVAAGALFVLRQDVVLPLVDAHKNFLTTIAQSQREIADAVKEQTKLLYALQPRSTERKEQ